MSKKKTVNSIAATRGQKKKDKGNVENGDVEEPPATEDVNWTENDHALTRALIAAILANSDIRKGLFLPPGSNQSTQRGGGKKKSHWLFLVATEIFSTHKQHSKAFKYAMETGSKERAKARESCMTEIVKAHSETMGKTGEGVLAEEDIDMSVSNALTNAWSAVKKDCPWYFDMRDLIAERPNAKPTGIGNSQIGKCTGWANPQTDVDLSILNSGPEDLTEPETVDTAIMEETDGDDDGDGEDVGDVGGGSKGGTSDGGDGDETQSDESDDEDGEEAGHGKMVPQKRKKKEELKSVMSKKKGKADTAAPAKKSKIKEFTTILEAEEKTRQQELDLEKTRVESLARIKIETARAALSAKVELEKQKAAERKTRLEAQIALSLRKEEMRLKHQLEVERIRYQRYQHSQTYQGGFHDSQSSSSPLASSIGMSSMSSNFSHDSAFFSNDAGLGLDGTRDGSMTESDNTSAGDVHLNFNH
ncbi:hypothetical protein CVT24_012570 [Panaeolus cyanescens]|uniref:No apical meristem-associated C-terminal domain-containing protein n=1 Tax=Panaeolus cyanescens TaxID=181874 RepID=A0A409YK03_9AGAR|nr:hypothetical protein CVT24_012570 [Panaeolus cyanescens]